MSDPLGTDATWDLRGTVSGIPNLIDALQRRLETPGGGLFYDPQYGFPHFEYVQSAVTDPLRFEIEQFTETECLKDERVETCSVSSELVGDVLNVRIRGTTAVGPFEFVVPVTEIGVGALYADA